MRLKKYILLMAYAITFLVIGLASIIVHFCLKQEHSLICYFINASILITLGLGAAYIFRGYQKIDSDILKGFFFACGVSIIAELVYCVQIAEQYPLFAKFAIIAGASNVAVISALFFGRDFSKKKSLLLCCYPVFSTLALLAAYMIIAFNPIFVDGNISNLTTMLDLVISFIFASILLISIYLKYEDKKERHSGN